MAIKKIASLVSLLLIISFAQAQTGRTVLDLSNSNWKLMLDTAAKLQDDQLYTPPVDIGKVPVNIPTGGWSSLSKWKPINVHLPATVEEFYWGSNGNAFGVSGNYLGVSWFTTQVHVPTAMKSKRLVLHFEAVRYRAEIFVNKKLVGYDLVNSTPFDIDVTEALEPGKLNDIAIRITDPNGNFDWRDSQNFMWGEYRTNPTHGFGGITGAVKLIATDKIFIDDIFVKNTPAINQVDVELTLANQLLRSTNGKILLQVAEAAGAKKIVYEKTYLVKDLALGMSLQKFNIKPGDVKYWSPGAPNLYTLTAKWIGNNNTNDSYTQRFGFRWFEVRDIAGDKQFYLNNKRIVLLTAISWGFWPVNGIAPSDALARKQIESAKKIGLNMLNFHRTIGQQNVLDYADELGLLYFEEPGGNQYPAERFNATDALGKMQADFYFTTRDEKLFRMIRRDRNHPSLVIYNMHNERGAQPQYKDSIQMQAAHRLDETRILTYNSSNGDIKIGRDPRFKLHLFPYDSTFNDYGWFDQHHAGGPGTYHDNLYKNPTDYLRYTDHKDEIIYYGEEGAIGTPPRLQLIRDEILKRGKNIGWETDAYLKWFDAYNNFLNEHPGFKKAFPNVDSLTRKMGNVAYYYQGRTIENIKINNTIDGYAVNGWESMKLENHSGIVDNYRNPKGDPQLISRYTKPLYVAVKLNHKVLSTGDTTIADLFIVNEENLHGNFDLELKVKTAAGKITYTKKIPVTISGGTTYGELLSAGNAISIEFAGYTIITADLEKNGKILATGDDQVFAVELNSMGIPAGMVADTSMQINAFLTSVGINNFKPFKLGRPEGQYLLVGDFQPQQTGNPLVTDILEWVNDGNTLIIAGNTETWATYLAKKEVLDFRGVKQLGTTWYGGNYFVKAHPLFEGLPQNCVFNWEYQCLATYNKNRLGLRLMNGETIVACVADHKPEVYSALSIIPHGRGRIIFSALDIISCIKDVSSNARPEGDGENAAMNTLNISRKNKANIVGQQLLLNMLRMAAGK